ncbi:FkbM family methyltransferase [Phyllobacterium ifriqiyense]|uniref:FkbM family methyltransferase n=1 Tax=Phyllobacterium ifriqiyense TaxID=314238 RepID=A0ABU0S5I2_9HYPH|nr:FkbM family methyltransferase [Phyllobacterium ifriqiyense]MDQ0996018.1 FkbM family methyltransferase [Phyllobacterium ifriqiyense]
MNYPFVADIKYRDRTIPFSIADAVGYEWYITVDDNHNLLREKCLHFVKPGSHVVDCGAHHGLMTVLFAQKTGPKGKVTAFDALESNAQVVRENAVLNRMPNITAHGKAIGDKTGTHKVLADTSNVILNDEMIHAPDGDFTVEVIALDDALLGDVDFLKIDVEGHEVAALHGARRLLRQLPVLDIEIHNFLFPSAKDHCFALLDALPVDGYLFSIDESAHWCEAHEINMYYLCSLPNPHLMAKPKARTRLEKFLRRKFDIVLPHWLREVLNRRGRIDSKEVRDSGKG